MVLMMDPMMEGDGSDGTGDGSTDNGSEVIHLMMEQITDDGYHDGSDDHFDGSDDGW